MLDAHKMQAEGMTQKEIGYALGVSERTVRNYLSQIPRKRKKPERKSKLDPFKDYVRTRIADNPGINGELIYESIQKMGYAGKKTVLKDYITKLRRETNRNAVIRFETEPGFQAQVDWVEFCRQLLDGNLQKLYAFIMVLGFSRFPFVKFTTSMSSEVLLACHQMAFRFFNGVPKEILYDNMKTAWIYDGSGWKTNRKLSSFAFHYSFIPRRCQVRRPETKGKVERFNQYFKNNFFASIQKEQLNLQELNDSVLLWIDKIKHNKISGLNESRFERFNQEKLHLSALPETDFDVRDMAILSVNRESCITWKTNRYSLPPNLIGKEVICRPDVFLNTMDVYFEGSRVRKIALKPEGSHSHLVFPEDKDAIRKQCENDLKNQQSLRLPVKKIRTPADEVSIRNPSFYEFLLAGETI